MRSTETSEARERVSRLRWSLHGSLAARDVLLLLHGPRGAPADWDPLLPALCEGAAWRCLCLDSTAQEAESIDAESVLALLDMLGAGTRAIVSSTSGSALAIRLETTPGFAATCFVQDGDTAAETSPTGHTRVLVCSESYDAGIHGPGDAFLHTVPGAGSASSILALEATAGAIRSALAPAHGAAPPTPFRARIVSAEVRRFSVALREPLQLSAGTAITERRGAMLVLETADGHRGVGEGTPLPAFHPESVDECAAQLERAGRALLGRSLDLSLPSLDGSFAAWLHSAPCAARDAAAGEGGTVHVGAAGEGSVEELGPCAAGAVEMAVLQVLARARGVPLPCLLAASAGVPLASHVALSGLATRDELRDLSGHAPSAPRGGGGGGAFVGMDVLKVKVGGGAPIKDEAARVAKIAADALAGGRRLRLDANQCWSLEEASEFARLLGSGGAAVDYIEEPLLDPLLLPLFSRQSGMRHALDESLYKHYIPSSRRSAPASGMPARERPASGLIDRPASEGGDGPAAGAHSPAALVLKPALMGGWEPCRTSIREAGPGVQAVLSACFESGVALAHYVALAASAPPLSLAASVPPPAVSHGLGTFEKLAEDTLDPPFSSLVRGGAVSVLECDAALASYCAELSLASLPNA